MALYFNATVDCGDDENSSRDIAMSFDGLQISIRTDLTTHCSGASYQADNGSWRVNIQPMGVSNASCIPGDVAHGELLSNTNRYAVAMAIYDNLRVLRGFRYAFVGFETQDYEFFDDFAPSFTGLVVREDLVGPHNEPACMEPFSPGYQWIPIFPGWLWIRKPPTD